MLGGDGYAFEQPCDTSPPLPSDYFISPSDGAVLTTSPWIPVKLEFDDPKQDWTNIRTWIDCVETTDPMSVQRPIPLFLGDGSDYIAYASLFGLDDGEHVMLVRLEDAIGTVEWQASRFTLLRPQNRLRVTVRNDAGDKVDARIVVLAAGAPYPLQSPDALAVDPQERDDEISTFLVPGGNTTMWLDEGEYELIATRGPLDRIDRQTVHVEGDTEVEFVVDAAFALHSTSTGDFHVHTGESSDSFLPQQVRVESLMASGLDLVAITDHERIDDLEEEIATVVGPAAPLLSMSAIEISMEFKPTDPKKEKPPTEVVEPPETSQGHMNAFPLDPTAEFPAQIDNLARFLEKLRGEQVDKNTVGKGILELNHPRGMQLEPTRAAETSADLFNELGFDPDVPFGVGVNAWMNVQAAGGTRGIDFDAMEIINRGAWPAYTQVRRDWFTLLGWGIRLTGVGNSDSHAMTTEWAGFPRNVAPCVREGASPKAKDAFVSCWVDAIEAGHVRVTTGPLVDLELHDGASTGAIGDLYHPSASVTATLRVRAADWVPVPEVRLVVDGELTETWVLTDADREKDGTLDLELSFPVTTTGGDQFVLAEAGWPLDQGYPDDATVLGAYALIVPEYLPLGFTNPVFVDGDGDGAWTP
jgi:hypothetical protein